MIQSILSYIGRSALLTVEQLAITLGPLLILAFILDKLAQCIRGRAARTFGLKPYIYLTAPGVMVHELGHAVFCVIFRHRIVSMHLFKPGPDGTLGSVEHFYNRKSIYQRIGNFFIGTGPIWFGSTVVCLLVWYLLGSTVTRELNTTLTGSGGIDLAATASQAAALAWLIFTSLFRSDVVMTWQFWVACYLIFCIGSHITLSRSDIRGAWGGFTALVLLVLLLNLLTLSFGEAASLRWCEKVLQESVVFYAGMTLVICLNLALAGVLLILSRVPGFRRS
jgi:hypothetical protein